jgi:hypothetical protein
MAQKSFSSLPRRKFLVLCAAVPALAKLVTGVRFSLGSEPPPAEFPLSFQPLPEADLAREVESLLQLVDPKVLHRYVPIDPQTNGWPFWKQAIEAYVPASNDDEFYEILMKRVDAPASLTESERQQVAAWVAANENWQKLFDQAILCGKVELPRATQSVMLDWTRYDSMKLRSLIQVKSVRTDDYLNRGAFAAAISEAASMLKAASILVRSECLNIDYLIAQCLLGQGVCAMYRVATAPAAPGDVARAAIDRLAEAKITIEHYKQAHRVEFCRWFLPWVAHFPSHGNPIELAKCFVLGPFGSDHKGPQAVLDEYRRAIHQTAILLEGHPNPLDKARTIRLASEVFATFIDDANQPYVNRVQNYFASLQNELRDWPSEVAADVAFVHLHDNTMQRRSLSQRQLKRAQAKLRGVDNVLGKLMIVHSSSLLGAATNEMHEARLESARLRIALRLFEKQRGALPAQLDELVTDGLLPAVPLDPYGGGPFQFSPERRTIWCVGQHGNNDGVIPESPEEAVFDEDIDLTWRIAPPAAP